MSEEINYLDLLPDYVEYSIPRYMTESEVGNELWSEEKFGYNLIITKEKNKIGELVWVVNYVYQFYDSTILLPHIPNEEILRQNTTVYDSNANVLYFYNFERRIINTDLQVAAKELYDWLVENNLI